VALINATDSIKTPSEITAPPDKMDADAAPAVNAEKLGAALDDIASASAAARDAAAAKLDAAAAKDAPGKSGAIADLILHYCLTRCWRVAPHTSGCLPALPRLDWP
jgi:hypothetical protein